MADLTDVIVPIIIILLMSPGVPLLVCYLTWKNPEIMEKIK